MDMTRHIVTPLAAAIGFGVAAIPAHAHHSYGAFFDICRTVTIEARVESVQWKDPHVMMELKRDGGTDYRAEWTGLRNLAISGITADVLKAGDRVVVTGSPWKDRALMDPSVRALVSDSPPNLD